MVAVTTGWLAPDAVIAAEPTMPGGAEHVRSTAAWRRQFSLDFRGLRAELRAADAVVLSDPIETVKDKSLVHHSDSTTRRPRGVRGVVRANLGNRRVPNTRDILNVVVDYDRHYREFYELEKKAGQFVWTTFPRGGRVLDGIILLRRSGRRWAGTRALFPDTAFVTAYVRAAALGTSESAGALMSMFLAEYYDHEGDFGQMRVLWDDLVRLERADSSVTRILDAQLARIPVERACAGGMFDLEMMAQLVPRFPIAHRKWCARSLLQTLDDSRKTRRDLERRRGGKDPRTAPWLCGAVAHRGLRQ